MWEQKGFCVQIDGYSKSVFAPKQTKGMLSDTIVVAY